VPDADSRGRIEQLLFEMDQTGVDQAVVICAQIDKNPDNNAYVAGEAKKYPSRIHQFPDVDCSWSPTYHAPGAADRLREVAEKWSIKGFTHYLKHDDDGSWLYSKEGLAFFAVAAEKKLIASISGAPRHQPALRQVAERFPSMPILSHHLAGVRAREGPSQPGLKEVLASAKVRNMYVKVSGFYYGASVSWEYPYSEVQWVVRTLHEHFGPHRLCWGSDYPVLRKYGTTYRQCLEAFRTHCTFVPDEDKAWILGDTLHKLLTTGQPS